METNKIDQICKEKLAQRTFKPSTSAWERLSVKLDEQPKQNGKNMFFYVMGIAASILLVVSLGIGFFLKDKTPKTIEEKVVIQPIDTLQIKQKMDELLYQIPTEKILVKQDTEIKNKAVRKNNPNKVVLSAFEKNSRQSQVHRADKKVILLSTISQKSTVKEQEYTALSSLKKDRLNPIKLNTKDTAKSRIKINSDDLLFAVSHTPEEVKAYYAKYKIDRNEVLHVIKNELEITQIKIEPSLILAEVERTIEDEHFQNNFIQLVKKKVFGIANAIASRNDE